MKRTHYTVTSTAQSNDMRLQSRWQVIDSKPTETTDRNLHFYGPQLTEAPDNVPHLQDLLYPMMTRHLHIPDGDDNDTTTQNNDSVNHQDEDLLDTKNLHSR